MFDRYPEKRTVIVNTKTGEAFRGVLWSRRRCLVVLRNAELLRGRGEATKLEGEVVIEVANVSFYQVMAVQS
jgi:small nuclear ribonucleoprotein (snRNP)-like protein